MDIEKKLYKLRSNLNGELHIDSVHLVAYATDASVYRSIPLAVALPKTIEDIQKIVIFCNIHIIPLIPRAAGTSLAGQCVGEGIVLDISKYLNEVIEINPKERWVRVQPGINRNTLNAILKPHGLFFSPITATSTRALIGGMIGNNSCGTNSIVYGTTRDKVIELKTILSDGSIAVFNSRSIINNKSDLKTRAHEIEGAMINLLSPKSTQLEITSQYPKRSIHRRNTGYALDLLIEKIEQKKTINLCELLAGSEGTLAITTEAKLKLDPLPPEKEIVIAAHFRTIHESMLATQYVMEHHPFACELMDKVILDCTKENKRQKENRKFIEGDPGAVLLIEVRGVTLQEIEAKTFAIISKLKENSLGYAFPTIAAPNTKKVWELRSAGLGLLANLPGDEKAVACIEDTAVDLKDLADYVAEFEDLMTQYNQRSVYYAHAGAGELHLRPILNLKTKKDRTLFYNISKDVASLVKKYKGSLSGEHGDGRVRANFIPLMIGDKNYQTLKEVKSIWDPKNIFNPGKIVDSLPMNESLRYKEDQKDIPIDTIIDFSSTQGILQLAEKCNGSGDCRKTSLSGGTMCPSYRATFNEKDTTRARANVLREFLTRSTKENKFDHHEIKEVMDLCLSCKACASECPSNVDMSSLKAEFQYQYNKANGIPRRDLLFAYINDLNSFGGRLPKLYNFLLSNKFTSDLAKIIFNIAPQRALPIIYNKSLTKWHRTEFDDDETKPFIKEVILFIDEFTNWNDVPIGKAAINLLTALGYRVLTTDHEESGRSALSKGLLLKAKEHATKNVSSFSKIVSEERVLIGIEPSAILTFKDEYPKLVDKEHKEEAVRLSEHTMLIDEFIAREIAIGNITKDQFTEESKEIAFHAHCHQKAQGTQEDTVWILSIPENYHVSVIPSGCCGMAGSFGYEAEHYSISQAIGNDVLFPTLRQLNKYVLVAANGTSCRHQIQDFTSSKAQHPVEILLDALKK